MSKYIKDIKWFLVESYKFISPKGFREHINFILYFPIAAYKFFTCK